MYARIVGPYVSSGAVNMGGKTLHLQMVVYILKLRCVLGHREGTYV